MLRPTPAEATRIARTKAFVVLGGTSLPTDRIAPGAPYYPGKRKRSRQNVQVRTDPFGLLLWASPVLSGSPHDLTAARPRGTVEALTDAGLGHRADKAHRDTGGSRHQRVHARSASRDPSP